MAIAPSFQDFLTQGQAEAQIRRPDLVFAEGDVTVAMLHGGAAMADANTRFSAQSFKETFLDGAQADALTVLVDDHLNIQRDAASAAQVTVDWSRTSAGAGGTIPTGSLVASEFDENGESVEYSTDAPFVVGAGLNGPFPIACTAVVPGAAGNARIATVTRVIDQPAFDPTFTCTNPAVAAGGNEEESDPDLRTRAREFFSTLRRGTLAALEFGAKVVSSVIIAAASEDITTGLVTVRVGDSDGDSTQQMIDDVVTELENWRCAGTAVTVVGGQRLEVGFGLTLTVRAGFDVAARLLDFEDATEARIDKLRVGETLFLDMVIAAILAVDPDNIFDVTFDSMTVGGTPLVPPADLIPGTTAGTTANDTVRAGTITFA